jgi:hypothetical protein
VRPAAASAQRTRSPAGLPALLAPLPHLVGEFDQEVVQTAIRLGCLHTHCVPAHPAWRGVLMAGMVSLPRSSAELRGPAISVPCARQLSPGRVATRAGRATRGLHTRTDARLARAREACCFAASIVSERLFVPGINRGADALCGSGCAGLCSPPPPRACDGSPWLPGSSPSDPRPRKRGSCPCVACSTASNCVQRSARIACLSLWTVGTARLPTSAPQTACAAHQQCHWQVGCIACIGRCAQGGGNGRGRPRLHGPMLLQTACNRLIQGRPAYHG